MRPNSDVDRILNSKPPRPRRPLWPVIVLATVLLLVLIFSGRCPAIGQALPGPALWPSGPYHDMAPGGRESSRAAYGPGLDVGALRLREGVWEVLWPPGQWIPYNPAVHWTAASMFNRYGQGWSFGPAHNMHGECAGFYEQVHGRQPEDMWRRDCEHSKTLFTAIRAQAAALHPAPEPPTPEPPKPEPPKPQPPAPPAPEPCPACEVCPAPILCPECPVCPAAPPPCPAPPPRCLETLTMLEGRSVLAIGGGWRARFGQCRAYLERLAECLAAQEAPR